MTASVNVSTDTIGDILESYNQGNNAYGSIGNGFMGMLEEFRFYKRELSVDELKTEMFQPLDLDSIDEHIVAYYKFNDVGSIQSSNFSQLNSLELPQVALTSNATTKDHSLHGNDATIRFMSAAPIWTFGPNPFTPACPLSVNPSQVRIYSKKSHTHVSVHETSRYRC